MGKPIRKTKEAAEAQPDQDIQFGVNWSAPQNAHMRNFTELQRRMICARWSAGDVSRFEHRKAIIKAIWPESVYSWHYWMDRRLKSVCDNHFVTWWGGGGCGKSTDSAILGLEYWLEAPHETAVIVCSTTKEMLRARIWGQITHYHSLIPRRTADGTDFSVKGELLDSSCFIQWRNDIVKDGNWKNGIKGVAVQDGPVEEAVNNIIGMHTTRVWWILDEMQGVREAIMKAIPNLLKNPESRMLGMGNPSGLTDLLCRYSEPKDGWDSITKFQDEWKTDSNGYEGDGICCFFDSRKSPAILDPAWGARNQWMVNQRQIDNHLNSKAVKGNQNDPEFMQQSIGWPPSQGLESTVLDNSILTTFKCQQEKPVWTDGFDRFAALDPAFNGGDRAVLQFGKRGFVRDQDGSRWVICFEETLIVPIDAESTRPIHYQILDFCKAQCEQRKVKPAEFAIASAGEGGGLKAIFDQEWGVVNGIEEGGKPSERMDDQGKLAKDKYDTRSSELALGLRDFAMNNGIRGLPIEAADQACKRLTFYRNGKWCVEPKRGSKGRSDSSGRALKGFKERLGYSPDHFDSCIIGVEHCRMKGANHLDSEKPRKLDEQWERQAQEFDSQFNERNYLEPEDYSQYQPA